MIYRGAREFILDLSKCPMMDSTFMDTLAAISFWLCELGEDCLSVVNLNERNTESLLSLGLDQLLNVRVSAISHKGGGAGSFNNAEGRPHHPGTDDAGSSRSIDQDCT
jgi:hypothetical protein